MGFVACTICSLSVWCIVEKLLIGSECHLSPRMRQLVGFGDCPTARGNFGNGCRRPIVTSGDFVAYWCESVWTDRATVWDGEWGTPRHWCIRWGWHAPRGRGGFGGFWMNEWTFISGSMTHNTDTNTQRDRTVLDLPLHCRQRNVFGLCEKIW